MANGHSQAGRAPHPLVRVALGGAASAAATVPMTVLMEAAFRRLPPAEQYPLPPREIVEELAEQTGAPLPRQEERRVWLTLVAHFGYGAGSGAVYGLDVPGAYAGGALRGAAFGVALWTASYLGWLPALRVLRPATEHPARRNALMVAAHVVWGGATGVLVHALHRRFAR